jgi:mRNA interferase RelE/StbE
MRKLALNKAVVKELAELPPKQYRQVVCAILDLLEEPRPHYSTLLAGTPYLRIAVGEYRVIYRVDDESVHVVLSGKRNDDEVHKQLERLKSS